MTIMTQSPCVKIASSGNVVYHTAATTNSVSSGTTQHRTAKLRIRPNNQAPPHNALQHLAPTIITPHYPTSYQPTSPNTTQHLPQYPASHDGPTNITYRPALSSTCPHHRVRRRPMLHHATQLCAAFHSIALPHTNLHYSASPDSCFLRSSIPSQQQVAISGTRTCNWSAIDKVYFVRYILSGIFCPVHFVRYILSGTRI